MNLQDAPEAEVRCGCDEQPVWGRLQTVAFGAMIIGKLTCTASSLLASVLSQIRWYGTILNLYMLQVTSGAE